MRRLWQAIAGEAPALGPLLIAFAVTFAYFIGPPAWNQNARLALTRALVEERTTAIDLAHHSTGDKSYRDGHFYCDKAPGTSLLALPSYAALHGLRQLTGGEPPGMRVIPLDREEAAAGRTPDPSDRKPGDRIRYNQAHRLALYVTRLCSVSLVALAGLVALYLLALRQLGDRRGAALVTAIYGLATPALAYSVALYGHQLCADFLLIALAIVVLAPADRRAAPLWMGACLGWAVLCEYPAAVPAGLLVGYAALARGWRYAAWVIVGGLPWAALLGLYHYAAFGDPLKTGYDFVYLPEFAEGMRVRYGIHAPDPRVLLELLFGSYRGLFYLAPALLLAAWGLAVELARAGDASWPRRQISALALAVLGYYLLVNSGYYMWDGGASLGPRHCVPALGLLALGLAPALRLAPRLSLALAALSALQMIVATSAAPEAPRFGDPLYSYAWPRLFAGAVGNYGEATNLGRLLGLPGPLSLAPLLAVWAWAAAQLARLGRSSDDAAQR
ncbi:MAG: hypothetical protein KC636_18965 [Myxococcales bacterium]|nr:hypothetical protein [Myxococcales bacterium]